MNHLSYITKKCQEANPRLLEWTLGCKFKSLNTEKEYVFREGGLHSLMDTIKVKKFDKDGKFTGYKSQYGLLVDDGDEYGEDLLNFLSL